MSKKRDPIVTVLGYFSSADLPLAEQALALVKEIVAKRRPLTAHIKAAGRSGSHKKKPTPSASVTPVPVGAGTIPN